MERKVTRKSQKGMFLGFGGCPGRPRTRWQSAEKDFNEQIFY